jgi:hypothetical protein
MRNGWRHGKQPNIGLIVRFLTNFNVFCIFIFGNKRKSLWNKMCSSLRQRFVQGCQIFLDTIYQNGQTYKLPLNDKLIIWNGRNAFQSPIEYINYFHSQALKHLPKLEFLLWKYTIWQPWFWRRRFRVFRQGEINVAVECWSTERSRSFRSWQFIKKIWQKVEFGWKGIEIKRCRNREVKRLIGSER